MGVVVPMLCCSFFQSAPRKPSPRAPSHLVEGLPGGRTLDGPDERGHRERAAQVSHGGRDRRRRRRDGRSADARRVDRRRRGRRSRRREGRRRVLCRRQGRATDGGASPEERGGASRGGCAQQSRAGWPGERRHWKLFGFLFFRRVFFIFFTCNPKKILSQKISPSFSSRASKKNKNQSTCGNPLPPAQPPPARAPPAPLDGLLRMGEPTTLALLLLPLLLPLPPKPTLPSARDRAEE